MNYRRMGKSGLRLSEISYGAWVTFGDANAEETQDKCMTAAYDAGVNFFDNAEAYASGQAEVVMGRILKRNGWRRESLVISTKIFWGGRGPNDSGLSHKHIIEGVNNALRRLQTDYVDLVYCHRPDPNTPIEETVRAIDILIKQGKAFYWGTSEWSAADILRADALARQYGLTPPTVEQPQYNLLHRRRMEGEYLPLFRDLGYGTTIWSPLASGVLTGKYNSGVPAGTRLADPNLAWLKDGALSGNRIAKVQKLEPIANALGGTLPQLAIAWCLHNPHVSSVITGASRPEQVQENLKALALVPKLTPEIIAKIDAIFAPGSNDDEG
jgi:voltage-dependent potassium channel beta subunit